MPDTNSSDPWIQTLSAELSEFHNRAFPVDELLTEISAFKTREPYHRLRESYPTDLSNWRAPKGANDILRPRMPGGDLLLRYLDTMHPGLKSRVANALSQHLEASVNGKPQVVIESLCAKEAARRGQGAPRKLPFWRAEAEHVSRKYCWLYSAVRLSGSEQVSVEPILLRPNPQRPMMIQAFWHMGNETWVGDLLVNPTKFMGLMLRLSTDALPEPVSIALLRRSSRLREAGPPISPPFCLSGQCTGWRDGSEEELLTSKMPLLPLSEHFPLAQVASASLAQIKALLSDPSVLAACRKFERKAQSSKYGLAKKLSIDLRKLGRWDAENLDLHLEPSNLFSAFEEHLGSA